MSNFFINIYTPTQIEEKNLAVDSLFIPTEFGQINILVGHTHLVTKLSEGILTVVLGHDEQRFLISRGICKIINKNITFLVDFCKRPEDLDAVILKSEYKDLLVRLEKIDPIASGEYQKLLKLKDKLQLELQLFSDN